MRFLLLICLVGLGLSTAHAQEKTDQAKARILKLERQRYDYMVKRNVLALNDLVTEDLTYVHSSGVSENKAQFLAATEKSTYASIEPKSEDVRIYGKTAIVAGIADFKMQNGAVTTLRFTNVYVKDGKQWKLAARHASKIQ
jgi:hypothetical protein